MGTTYHRSESRNHCSAPYDCSTLSAVSLRSIDWYAAAEYATTYDVTAYDAHDAIAAWSALSITTTSPWHVIANASISSGRVHVTHINNNYYHHLISFFAVLILKSQNIMHFLTLLYII